MFAGSRGCGKTTTARILARALNCEKGPTPDPCGECDACVEIAQGRDIDVLEIDAASHTGIDNIREVVIAGLSIAPVRDRYKVFIIDEVHQLSTPSFNALLKSIEEPPPHVVFMMATTELHKIPDTILSRSQVFEFRTIPAKAIADAAAARSPTPRGIEVPDAALALDRARGRRQHARRAERARPGDGVCRHRRSPWTTSSTVLGLVGRDLLFDLIEAVVDEDGPRAFALADRAVESGHDLKLVCRELSRVVRDMMILSVDPARAGDGELAEGERERLTQLAGRFSREDLMRAFDLLAKAEQDIRVRRAPALSLRDGAAAVDAPAQAGAAGRCCSSSWRGSGSSGSRTRARARARSRAPPQRHRAAATARTSPRRSAAPTHPRRRTAPSAPKPAPAPAEHLRPRRIAGGSLKDALLAEIRSGKGFFYNTVVAQAQTIEVVGRPGDVHLPADAPRAARAVRADAAVARGRRRARRRPEGVGRVPAG